MKHAIVLALISVVLIPTQAVAHGPTDGSEAQTLVGRELEKVVATADLEPTAGESETAILPVMGTSLAAGESPTPPPAATAAWRCAT